MQTIHFGRTTNFPSPRRRRSGFSFEKRQQRGITVNSNCRHVCCWFTNGPEIRRVLTFETQVQRLKLYTLKAVCHLFEWHHGKEVKDHFYEHLINARMRRNRHYSNISSAADDEHFSEETHSALLLTGISTWAWVNAGRNVKDALISVFYQLVKGAELLNSTRQWQGQDRVVWAEMKEQRSAVHCSFHVYLHLPSESASSDVCLYQLFVIYAPNCTYLHNVCGRKCLLICISFCWI